MSGLRVSGTFLRVAVLSAGELLQHIPHNAVVYLPVIIGDLFTVYPLSSRCFMVLLNAVLYVPER